MKRILYLILLISFPFNLNAQNSYKTEKNISYIPSSETDVYRKERCKLDIYYPENNQNFSTVVWFHGGGLEGGEKYIPKELKGNGIAVVAVNYRLSPRAKNPAYTRDAAAAVAWVFNNIGKYGGRKDKIFVSGHSAGGYLTLMLALDKKYLKEYNIDADQVAAYLPVSGQTLTHFTIRKERGVSQQVPVIDEYAPVHNIRQNTAPIILITGDRNLEMADRWEENALLASMLKNIGNKNVSMYQLAGFDHGRVVGPACLLIANYIKDK